jgi:uncharacterized membrane protein
MSDPGQGRILNERVVDRGTLRAGLWAYGAFLLLAVVLWLAIPDRYPVNFDLAGRPSRTAEGPGMWILLVAICSISFGQGHLFQRFLLADPNSTLLNVPYKRLFHQLPVERRLPVLRRSNRLLGLINLGVVLLHSVILVLIHLSARYPGSIATVGAHAVLWLVILLLLGVPFLEVTVLRRMIRRKLEEEGLLEPVPQGP